MKRFNRNLIRRTGRRCGGVRKLSGPNPNLSNLVISYKKMKDMGTLKPLTNTQISKDLVVKYISLIK